VTIGVFFAKMANSPVFTSMSSKYRAVFLWAEKVPIDEQRFLKWCLCVSFQKEAEIGDSESDGDDVQKL